MSDTNRTEMVQGWRMPSFVYDLGDRDCAELSRWADARQREVAEAKLARNRAEAEAASAREEGRRAREALRGLEVTMSALDGKPCWCPGEPHDPECLAARAVLAESDESKETSNG